MIPNRFNSKIKNAVPYLISVSKSNAILYENSSLSRIVEVAGRKGNSISTHVYFNNQSAGV